jgi:hypothetical protein
LDAKLKPCDSYETTKTQIYGLKDLFKHKSLRNASFGFMVVSLTLHLIYYGGYYFCIFDYP